MDCTTGFLACSGTLVATRSKPVREGRGVAAANGSMLSKRKLYLDQETWLRSEPERSDNLSREIDIVREFILQTEPADAPAFRAAGRRTSIPRGMFASLSSVSMD